MVYNDNAEIFYKAWPGWAFQKIPQGKPVYNGPAGLAQSTLIIDGSYNVTSHNSDPLTNIYVNGSPYRANGVTQQGQFNVPINFYMTDISVSPNITPNNPFIVYNEDTNTFWAANEGARVTQGGGLYCYHASPVQDTHGGSLIRGLDIFQSEFDNGEIPHVTGIEIDGTFLYPGGFPFVPPAMSADSGYVGYYVGTNPLLKMGARLALSPSLTPQQVGITTPQGLILFTAWQKYGVVIVDTTGISSWFALVVDNTGNISVTGEPPPTPINITAGYNYIGGTPAPYSVLAAQNDILAMLPYLQIVTGFNLENTTPGQSYKNIITAAQGNTGILSTTILQDGSGNDLPVAVSQNTFYLLDGNALQIKNQANATKVIQFNAGNITSGQTRTFTFPDASGTLVLANALPLPTLTTLGGVEACTQTSHQWIQYIDTSGVPHLTQPSYNDISGTPPVATTAAISPILPFSVVIPSGSYGLIFPTIYTGAGGNAAPADSGWGVIASLGSDATFGLRFVMPNNIPSGTMKLRMLALANATSGEALYTVSDGAVSPGSSPSAVSLTAETQNTLTWAGGNADAYLQVLTPLSASVSGNQILVVAITFNHTSWTLAQPSTWIPSIIWQ